VSIVAPFLSVVAPSAFNIVVPALFLMPVCFPLVSPCALPSRAFCGEKAPRRLPVAAPIPSVGSAMRLIFRL
ncbi:MAG: hypothetical protein Q4E44_04470, partial [bacterium]|nr:hypothetical protein [bacterium]